MKKPNRTEEKYWTGTRNFNHIQYESDLEDYISQLELQTKQLSKHDVSDSLPSTEYCIEKAKAMIKIFRKVDANMFPTMAIRAETLDDFVNEVMSVRQ